jgi:hypothetical protein
MEHESLEEAVARRQRRERREVVDLCRAMRKRSATSAPRRPHGVARRGSRAARQGGW